MTLSRREVLKSLAGIGAASAASVAVIGPWKAAEASTAAPLRPPGALPEDDFTATCIRCMRCVDACPNHAIESLIEGAVGTPAMNPRRQACMLCSRVEGDYLRCTEVCPSGALRPILKNLQAIRAHVKIGVAKIDFNLCYSYNNYTCGTCYHACPLQGEALKIGLWERPRINPEACVGCGLCERACIRYPQAIRVEAVDRTASVAGRREGRS